MTTNNELYYMVGVSGSGKTTVCNQLVDGQETHQSFASSSRLESFLVQRESSWYEFNKLSPIGREKLINEFHQTCLTDKHEYKLSIADGHMWVENPIQGGMWSAMASDNQGITNGLIYLNTPCETILEQIKRDNKSNKRKRKVYSVNEVQRLAEEEFSAAEKYCIERGLKFGVLMNQGRSDNHQFSDIKDITEYYLPQSSSCRAEYHRQFDTALTPSQLRALHHEIGKRLIKAFETIQTISDEDWQVLAIPRSANMLAYGFADNFNGPLLFENRTDESIQGFEIERSLVIVDSVIHSGATLERVFQKLPKGYVGQIHIVCLSINIGALDLLERLKNRVTFHCCGFSNKEERPRGERDMGARLFGTNE